MRLCRPSLASHLPLRFATEDIWVGEDEPSAAPGRADASEGGGPTVDLVGVHPLRDTDSHSSAIRSNDGVNDGGNVSSASASSEEPREHADGSIAGPPSSHLADSDARDGRSHASGSADEQPHDHEGSVGPHRHPPQQPPPRSLEPHRLAAGAAKASSGAAAVAASATATVTATAAAGGSVEELFASRVEQRDAVDSLGLTGMLLLPQSFG